MLHLISFSYKKGVPEGADRVFDLCRKVRNPWSLKPLRKLNGLHPKVQELVANCGGGQRMIGLIGSYNAFADYAVDPDDSSSELTIAVGCTGGQHRSVAIVELVAKRLIENGQMHFTVVHRDLKV